MIRRFTGGFGTGSAAFSGAGTVGFADAGSFLLCETATAGIANVGCSSTVSTRKSGSCSSNGTVRRFVGAVVRFAELPAADVVISLNPFCQRRQLRDNLTDFLVLAVVAWATQVAIRF